MYITNYTILQPAATMTTAYVNDHYARHQQQHGQQLLVSNDQLLWIPFNENIFMSGRYSHLSYIIHEITAISIHYDIPAAFDYYYNTNS